MMNSFDKMILDPFTKKIFLLKKLYDNGEISESELSNDEIDEIIKLYEEETKRIEADTNKRKVRIRKKILELRNS